MKINKYTYITILVAVIGFFLPIMVAAVQDHYLDGQISQEKLASIEVAIESNDDGIIEALKLAYDYDKEISLNNNDEVQSTAMVEAVLADLSLFADSGLDGIDINLYLTYTAIAKNYTLISQDSTLARSYWMIDFYDGSLEDLITTIVLDEKSMKIVSFSFNYISTGFEYDMQQIWADTLTDYYGFKGSKIISSELKDNYSKDEYPIQFYDDTGEDVTANFIKTDSSLWFNIFTPD